MKIGIIDIETTGFLQAGGKIVEIGLVSLDLLTGEKHKVLDIVVKEKAMMNSEIENSWICQHSNLTPEEVINAPFLEDQKQMIQEKINAFVNGVTAFNNQFDFGFLKDRGFTFPKELDCPMKLATPICKLPKKNTRYPGYKWPNVEEAYLHLIGEKIVEDHRGASDALFEADIVFDLYKKGVFTV